MKKKKFSKRIFALWWRWSLLLMITYCFGIWIFGIDLFSVHEKSFDSYNVLPFWLEFDLSKIEFTYSYMNVLNSIAIPLFLFFAIKAGIYLANIIEKIEEDGEENKIKSNDNEPGSWWWHPSALIIITFHISLWFGFIIPGIIASLSNQSLVFGLLYSISGFFVVMIVLFLLFILTRVIEQAIKFVIKPILSWTRRKINHVLTHIRAFFLAQDKV